MSYKVKAQANNGELSTVIATTDSILFADKIALMLRDFFRLNHGEGFTLFNYMGNQIRVEKIVVDEEIEPLDYDAGLSCKR